MQKRVLTVIILIVGISLGVTFLPTAWTAIGNADNMWLNNSLTNGLIGAIILYYFFGYRRTNHNWGKKN